MDNIDISEQLEQIEIARQRLIGKYGSEFVNEIDDKIGDPKPHIKAGNGHNIINLYKALAGELHK